jgi:heterodisulfide reductase subunit B
VTNQTYLFFPGCKINRSLPQYGQSTRTVLAALGLEVAEFELTCCGYPVRSENFLASMAAAARNLAIAADKGLAILTPCKCCFGNLKYANHWLRESKDLRQQVNTLLAAEGLKWQEDIPVGHLLTVLDQEIGDTVLQSHITQPLSGVKVAAHYGCHALRPGNITGFDNPLTPTIFERLIEITGATTVDWPLRLDCCGRPLWDKNNRFSLALMNNKLADARQAGAQIMATACTYCQMQFDGVQAKHGSRDEPPLPAVLYSQLLGAAMGLDYSLLGLSENRIAWRPRVK